MSANDIILTLTPALGPLKTTLQPEDSGFDKFKNLLKQSLTQHSLAVKSSSIQFPHFQTGLLPEDINEELERMTHEMAAAHALRKPADPVFWLRQRNVPVIAGLEERVENCIEPAFPFGSFNDHPIKPVRFDFFQVPKQLQFQIPGTPDFIIISLPAGVPLPSAAGHANLNFEDCTIWLSVKTIISGDDKKYIGIRGKNCTFSGFTEVLSTGIISNFTHIFTISFEPGDDVATGIENAQHKADYPAKIVLSVIGTKWSLQSLELQLDKIRILRTSRLCPVVDTCAVEA